MCLFRHDELPGSRREIRELQKFDASGRLNLERIFPPHRHHRQMGREAAELTTTIIGPYGAKQSIQGHVCHFCCHLSDAERRNAFLMMPDGWFPRPETYFLDELPGTIGNLPLTPTEVSLVFLGTCRSGVPDATRISAVDVFQFFQPAALIGTLADVPDEAAAEFSIAFYGLFCSGSCLGVALRASRVKLLREFLNPFGLLFTSYFGEDLHLAVRQDRREAYIPDERSALAVSPQ
jgi:hypothetical protein